MEMKITERHQGQPTGKRPASDLDVRLRLVLEPEHDLSVSHILNTIMCGDTWIYFY